MEEIGCLFHVDTLSSGKDLMNPEDEKMDAECHNWAEFDLDSEEVHAVV